MIKINFRPLFIWFCNLILGIIVLCFSAIKHNVFSNILLGFYIAYNIIAVILFIFSFIKLKHLNIVKIRKFTIVIFLGLISSLLCCLPILISNNNSKTMVNTDVCAEVNGIKYYENLVSIEANNISLNNEKAKGKLFFRMNTFNCDNLKLKIGDVIKFSTDVYVVNYSYENMNLINNNIKFKCTDIVDNIQILDSKKNIKSVIKNGVLNNFESVLNDENSKLAYSMIFGAKEYLSRDIFNVFSYSGLAHILAVSGLHVGFLVALILFILNLFRFNNTPKLIIISMFLLFYCYLTNFVPSVLRASIMIFILLFSKAQGKEYDALNSLSLAGIIILLLKPTELFSAGFQLSFGCVYSIICLARPIKYFLQRIKLPNCICDGLSISLAVNIGIMTITAIHFNTVNFVSILSNLIVLPIFSICFALLFLFGLLSFIPYFNILLYIPSVLLHFIKLFANYFSNVTFLNFKVFKMYYSIIILSMAFLFVSHFVISKLNVKFLINGIILTIILGVSIFANIPNKFDNYSINLVYEKYGTSALVTNDSNKKILVLGDVQSLNNIDKMLFNNKINKLDCLVIYDFYFRDVPLINKLVNSYQIKNLYLSTNYRELVLDHVNKQCSIIFFEDKFIVYNINFEQYIINKSCALKIDIKNNSILFLADGFESNKINSLSVLMNDRLNLIISNNNNIEFDKTDLNAENYILFKETKQKDNVVNLKHKLNFTKVF